MSLRVVSVEGNSHWRTDSREIALLEVGSDALPRQSGHRSPEALNAAWVRGSCGFVLPSGRDAELIGYRQSPRPRRSSSALSARTMRLPHSWKY